MAIEVYGVRETLNELRKLEPTLYKEIRQNLIISTTDLTQAVGNDFPAQPLRNWHSKGPRRGDAKMPPYSQAGAAKGVKAKTPTSRRSNAVLRIEQTNAGGAVFDSAGGRSKGQFVKNLDKHYRVKSNPPIPRSRVMYSSVFRNMDLVEQKIQKVIFTVERLIQTRIVRGA